MRSPRRRVYIEFPERDDMAKRGNQMGRLVKAMYGTRDAPQMLSVDVRAVTGRLGYRASVLHASVFYHFEKTVSVVMHVDDVLCVGPWEKLEEWRSCMSS